MGFSRAGRRLGKPLGTYSRVGLCARRVGPAPLVSSPRNQERHDLLLPVFPAHTTQGSRLQGAGQADHYLHELICINTAMTFSQGPKPEKKGRPGRLLTILGGTGQTPGDPRREPKVVPTPLPTGRSHPPPLPTGRSRQQPLHTGRSRLWLSPPLLPRLPLKHCDDCLCLCPSPPGAGTFQQLTRRKRLRAR